jgi:hypothetical protein
MGVVKITVSGETELTVIELTGMSLEAWLTRVFEDKLNELINAQPKPLRQHEEVGHGADEIGGDAADAAAGAGAASPAKGSG